MIESNKVGVKSPETGTGALVAGTETRVVAVGLGLGGLVGLTVGLVVGLAVGLGLAVGVGLAVGLGDGLWAAAGIIQRKS